MKEQAGQVSAEKASLRQVIDKRLKECREQGQLIAEDVTFIVSSVLPCESPTPSETPESKSPPPSMGWLEEIHSDLIKISESQKVARLNTIRLRRELTTEGKEER